MRKILVASGVVLGALILAGYGKQAAPAPSPQVPALTVPPSSPIDNTAPSDLPGSNGSMMPGGSGAEPSTFPANANAENDGFNPATRDLNSVDTNAPYPNDINSTDLQK